MTGKSTIIETLSNALNKLHKEEQKSEYKGVEKSVMNPKAIEISELFGNFSHQT